MSLLTIALVISMAFGGWQLNKSNTLDNKLLSLVAENIILKETSEINFKNAERSAEISNANKNIADSINGNLTKCVKDLEHFESSISSFRDSNEIAQAAIKELENLTLVSNLNQCFIPDWLADEITRDGLPD
tara:strand:- start:435 stop:830 length:396 start_codon:yes stop_codon:yes gene_type:complete